MEAGIHTGVATGYSGGNDSVDMNPNLGRSETSHKVYVLLSPDTPPSSIIINWRHGSLGFPHSQRICDADGVALGIADSHM